MYREVGSKQDRTAERMNPCFQFTKTEKQFSINNLLCIFSTTQLEIKLLSIVLHFYLFNYLEMFLCHSYRLYNLQVWEDADRTLWQIALMSGNLMRK